MVRFDDQEQDLQRFRNRVVVAAIFALLLFMVLLTRFVYLQILKHDYYSTRAESNRIAIVPIAPNRGTIVDRNGVVLAENYSAFTLEITPTKTAGLEQTIDGLAEIITIEPKDRLRFNRQRENLKDFQSIPIRTRLTDEEVARFSAHRYRFPGVEIQARLFRQYPENALAAHVLGFTHSINPKDQEWIEAQEEAPDYKGTESIGKTGLERHYEFELHGTTGYQQLEVDKVGRPVRILSHIPPSPGNNLTLTLDSKLQAVAEQAFGGRRGALAAIDPNNGAVLALVSAPGFDPNLFVDGIRFDDWNELNNNPDRPMNNRVLNGAYPPGSTFKPLMALAALTQGKRAPNQFMADPGYFDFGNRRFMDDKVGGHGMVDIVKSIIVSCNTYYYVLANDMGIDRIASFMGQLGLGQPTGIDLPGESSGILPSPEWKKKRFKKPEQQKWYAGETISIGIGQGYNAYTPLQMAHALANILNYGTVYRPHLVNTITNPSTGETRAVEPTPVRQIPLKKEHVDLIKQAMAGVNTQGTGARAFAGAAYTSGGKTGTAQVAGLNGRKYIESQTKERLRDHSWFIAFAPVEQPKIVVAVLVENGGFGAKSAAPIARQVFDYYLQGQQSSAPALELEDASDESP